MTLALGTMTWGREADEAEARSMYALARERGVVWFDTAALYSDGEAERILGRCLRDDPKRDEVEVSTKGGYRGEDICEEIAGSLKRLGVGRVALYLHHHWGRHGDDDVLWDLAWNRRIDAFGLSNCSAWQAAAAYETANGEVWPSRTVSALQVLYSLAKRQAESELLPFAKANDLQVFAYSPLASGLLTGKYAGTCNWRDEETKHWRLHGDERYGRRFADWPGLPAAYPAAAADLNMSLAQLAVSWVESHPQGIIPIVGARNCEQLAEVLGRQTLNQDQRRYVGSMFRAPPPATDRLEERE